VEQPKYDAKNSSDKKGSRVRSRGYMECLSNNPLLAVASFERHRMDVVSTMHNAELNEPATINRKNSDGSQLNVECPPDYQQCMKGIDRGIS